MPYIKQTYRAALDPTIKNIIDEVLRLEDAQPGIMAGNLNYIFSCILDRLYRPLNYAKINEVMGLLTCIQHEYYHRVARPYEEFKMNTEGDVFYNQQY